MSIHKSLVPRSKLKRHRNVLSRTERIERLTKEERWKEGDTVFGLPKVRNILQRVKAKKKEAAAEGAAAEGAAPTAEGAESKAPAGKEAASAKGAGAPAAGGAVKKDAKKEKGKK